MWRRSDLWPSPPSQSTLSTKVVAGVGAMLAQSPNRMVLPCWVFFCLLLLIRCMVLIHLSHSIFYALRISHIILCPFQLLFFSILNSFGCLPLYPPCMTSHNWYCVWSIEYRLDGMLYLFENNRLWTMPSLAVKILS